MTRLVDRMVVMLALPIFVTVAGCASIEPAPRVASFEEEPVQSVLWVGNSFFFFNNGIHRYISGLSGADASSKPLRNTMVAIGGAGIDWHDLDAYLRPGSKMGWYSFVGDNEIVFNKPGRQYDTVVIMDCSQCPIHPQLKGIFQEYARKDAGIARGHGVRPVLFMSWAYKDVPAMTAQLDQAYTAEGKANGALVIPAGLAFARAVARRPELELYQSDKRHPTLAGTYLAACTSYAAVTGRSPVGNKYTGGLDAPTASFLQGVAWDTVQEYRKR
jgi:hypothetical protein